ncbi:hypothetical protein THIOM_002861 [Candidatus Thiomargarita nelsonii]|uniref:Uncharacterized protein n=1 Tax=Candidatus Thiomargarita nelsonii TaxID=1003181 RepID=A0A176RZY3_9GAMM|nr:hypothetical protein THIOM_002861 [Candidatus Thiomargarita nelsonii]
MLVWVLALDCQILEVMRDFGKPIRYIFINKCYHLFKTHTGQSPGGGISQRPKNS